jgi:hypothetical protein
MTRALVPRFLALLDFSNLSDDEVHTTVSDIKTASTTSALVLANPAMAASATALVAKDGILVKANTKVSDDKLKLKTDTADEAVARADVHGELRTYAMFASNFAKSLADLHSAGVLPRPPKAPRNTVPDAPDMIDQKPPKKGHGKMVVSVHETGTARHQYIAEQSLDGITYTPLGVGRGKTRVLTGATGTKIWVRFARVRGQLVSEWSAPVLVVIP